MLHWEGGESKEERSKRWKRNKGRERESTEREGGESAEVRLVY